MRTSLAGLVPVEVPQPPVMKHDTVAPVANQLPGEAMPRAYDASTARGERADLFQAVFAIVRYDSQGKMHLLGTGFFITTNGLFVTARHVLMDTFDNKGQQKYSIGIIQFLPASVYLHRPILRCASHPTADVTVGVAAPMKSNTTGLHLTNKVLTLTLVPPGVDARVVTYAYPKHANLITDTRQQINFIPTFYDGDIKEYYPNGRDSVLLPEPCYRTSIRIHGGASGGPVFSRSGSVFGVNSTGIDGTDISYVSRIDEILALTIDGVAIEAGEPASPVTVLQMVDAGYLIVRRDV
ncbi:MAG TPA: serine protease [Pyrinomonadaceae bacterium]